jgi:hypothetical protein
MALLDADDVAYMRATQDEAMPTTAVLRRQAGVVSDGMGGTTSGSGAPTPIMVRLNMANDKSSGGDVPQNLAQKYAATDLVLIHVDPTDPALNGLPLATQDRITVGTTVYVVVSEGWSSTWTTAVAVWAVLDG